MFFKANSLFPTVLLVIVLSVFSTTHGAEDTEEGENGNVEAVPEQEGSEISSPTTGESMTCHISIILRQSNINPI